MTGGIMVVGTITQDYVEGAGHLDGELGGSATYFTLINPRSGPRTLTSALTLAAQHFASVSVVGVVGADREGELRETLRAADLRHLSVSPRPTYAWHASRGHGADAVTVNRFEGAYDRYEPQLPSAAAWPATVFLGSCAPRTQLAVIEAAPPGTVFAGDSMDIFISANHGEVERMVSRLRYLLLTETELSMLARSRGIATSAIWALERFTMDALVIKRGPQGAVLWTRDGSARLPACPVQVVDPTGAGGVTDLGPAHLIRRPDSQSDAALAKTCRTSGSKCFRGSVGPSGSNAT